MLLRMKNRQIKIKPEAIEIAFPNLWKAWGGKIATPVAVQEVTVQEITFPEEQAEAPIKRGRGRPKASPKKEVA
jgi:hypothetical protein